MSEYGRKVDIRIEIDVWKWPEGTLGRAVDVTNDILNYRFQKTIKAPQGSCQLAVLPQSATTHIMDVFKPMDVVRIYEFGVVKFIGFITRVSYSGAIGSDGKPSRNATITCQQFGGLLQTSSIGMGLGTALGLTEDVLVNESAKLSLAILRGMEDGISFAEIVGLLYTSFRDFLEAIGASNFLTYVSQYFDASSGLSNEETPTLPRTVELFTGTESSLTFWQLAEQIAQKPFNELWIDNGARSVSIDGSNVRLPEKSCMVFRPTPFNGTVTSAGTAKLWDGLPKIDISADYLLRFDLARSMDEVYTFYSVKEPAFQLAEIPRLLLGRAKVDRDRLGKYLFRPLITELFYTRVETAKGDGKAATSKEAADASDMAAQTLLNWFEHNDDYLSGTIQLMVPEDDTLDPRIGEKIGVYGIEGDFYVEGIVHTWQYQGPLKSTLTVTRGYNRNSRIKLEDRIFRRNSIR